jgi:hypothetical protein
MIDGLTEFLGEGSVGGLINPGHPPDGDRIIKSNHRRFWHNDLVSILNQLISSRIVVINFLKPTFSYALTAASFSW